MTSPARRRTDLRSIMLLGRIPVVARVVLFGIAIAAAGTVLLAATPSATITPDRAWGLPFFGLVIAFAIAEGAALHVEIRKESHSLSLSAVPLMFGLLYLSPVHLLAAYVLGAVPALIWIRRSPLLKATWNACLFVLQVGVAGLVVKTFLGDELPDTALEWLVPLGAVLAAEMLSLIAVPLVIMAVDAKFRPGLFAAVGHSQILAALAGAFTVTAMSASVGDPIMIVFALVPVLGTGALLRSTGHLAQRFEDLQQLHDFTRALTNERGARTLDTGLAHLVEVMRSRVAGLLTDGADELDSSSLRLLVDDAFLDVDAEEVAPILLEVVGAGPVVFLDYSDERPVVAHLLRKLGVQRVLAARVLGEVDRAGVLFVADRLGMRDDFTADEVRLFGSLADTLSARLSNDHLVEELETQAQHDALTGLPNRLSFEIALTSCLADADRSGAVIMVDLDRFKEINDSLGHEMGDQLLIEVARRLSAATRSTDMVARFGGDEFAMLLADRAGGPVVLDERILEIHEALTRSVQLNGITFQVGASLGAAKWPAQGTESASLLHRADTAMYQAKRNQLGVVWYTPELDDDAPRRLDLYLSAGSALENEEFYVHLQPKVSTSDGRITGAEALTRWTHPAHGPISPNEFVPLIEHAGLIGTLTRFVIDRAAQTATTLAAAGIDLPIAVNLTPRDLLDPTLPDAIAEALARHHLQPGAIEIEITEDAMIVDFDTSITVLMRIRELGLQIAIDDFGTGYSSLQHLHRLPVDQMKIDRCFITRLSNDDSASAIVRASIGLGRDLGLRTIAEGVEDERALALVSEFGCDEVQGYHISRPLPAAEFMRWVNEWNPATFRTGPGDDRASWKRPLTDPVEIVQSMS
ncbi:MAG: putative bifunctional diguanylate cyclase/phosphodiesterase [Ilumatobacteraceae bacterium]